MDAYAPLRDFDGDDGGGGYGQLRNSSERRWRQARRETKERRMRFESRARDMAATDAMQTRIALEERRRQLRQQNSSIRMRAPLSPATRKRQQDWLRQRQQKQEAIESEQRREQAKAKERARKRKVQGMERQKELKSHIAEMRRMRGGIDDGTNGIASTSTSNVDVVMPARRNTSSSSGRRAAQLPAERRPHGNNRWLAKEGEFVSGEADDSVDQEIRRCNWQALKAEAGKGLTEILENGLEFAEDATSKIRAKARARQKQKQDFATAVDVVAHVENACTSAWEQPVVSCPNVPDFHVTFDSPLAQRRPRIEPRTVPAQSTAIETTAMSGRLEPGGPSMLDTMYEQLRTRSAIGELEHGVESGSGAPQGPVGESTAAAAATEAQRAGATLQGRARCNTTDLEPPDAEAAGGTDGSHEDDASETRPHSTEDLKPSASGGRSDGSGMIAIEPTADGLVGAPSRHNQRSNDSTLSDILKELTAFAEGCGSDAECTNSPRLELSGSAAASASLPWFAVDEDNESSTPGPDPLIGADDIEEDVDDATMQSERDASCGTGREHDPMSDLARQVIEAQSEVDAFERLRVPQVDEKVEEDGEDSGEDHDADAEGIRDASSIADETDADASTLGDVREVVAVTENSLRRSGNWRRSLERNNKLFNNNSQFEIDESFGLGDNADCHERKGGACADDDIDDAEESVSTMKVAHRTADMLPDLEEVRAPVNEYGPPPSQSEELPAESVQRQQRGTSTSCSSSPAHLTVDVAFDGLQRERAMNDALKSFENKWGLEHEETRHRALQTSHDEPYDGAPTSGGGDAHVAIATRDDDKIAGDTQRRSSIRSESVWRAQDIVNSPKHHDSRPPPLAQSPTAFDAVTAAVRYPGFDHTNRDACTKTLAERFRQAQTRAGHSEPSTDSLQPAINDENHQQVICSFRVILPGADERDENFAASRRVVSLKRHEAASCDSDSGRLPDNSDTCTDSVQEHTIVRRRDPTENVACLKPTVVNENVNAVSTTSTTTHADVVERYQHTHGSQESLKMKAVRGGAEAPLTREGSYAMSIKRAQRRQHYHPSSTISEEESSDVARRDPVPGRRSGDVHNEAPTESRSSEVDGHGSRVRRQHYTAESRGTYIAEAPQSCTGSYVSAARLAKMRSERTDAMRSVRDRDARKRSPLKTRCETEGSRLTAPAPAKRERELALAPRASTGHSTRANSRDCYSIRLNRGDEGLATNVTVRHAYGNRADGCTSRGDAIQGEYRGDNAFNPLEPWASMRREDRPIAIPRHYSGEPAPARAANHGRQRSFSAGQRGNAQPSRAEAILQHAKLALNQHAGPAVARNVAPAHSKMCRCGQCLLRSGSAATNTYTKPARSNAEERGSFSDKGAACPSLRRRMKTALSFEESKLEASVERLDTLLKTYKEYSPGTTETVAAMDVWNSSIEESKLKASLARLDLNLKEVEAGLPLTQSPVDSMSVRQASHQESRMRPTSSRMAARVGTVERTNKQASSTQGPPNVGPRPQRHRHTHRRNVGYTGKQHEISPSGPQVPSSGLVQHMAVPTQGGVGSNVGGGIIHIATRPPRPSSSSSAVAAASAASAASAVSMVPQHHVHHVPQYPYRYSSS